MTGAALAALSAASVHAAPTTIHVARLIDVPEPGKSADIIAVRGDPLQDVTVLKKVEFVMARGEVVKP